MCVILSLSVCCISVGVCVCLCSFFDNKQLSGSGGGEIFIKILQVRCILLCAGSIGIGSRNDGGGGGVMLIKLIRKIYVTFCFYFL